MSPTSPDAGPRAAGWPRLARAALAFVVLTLAALVAVPALVQRRVDALRSEIEAAEPARTLLGRLRFDLARQVAALREVPAAGAPDPAATYTAARADEAAVFAELAPLAAGLGPEVEERFARLRALAGEWHDRVAEEEILRRQAAGAAPAAPSVEQPQFEAVLAAAAATDSAILRATALKRERIRSIEVNGFELTLLMGTLALLAAGVVGVLSSRVRRYAEEAERRTREAEAALAETARATEARARLLRGVTHDVKNPLGAAKGYAELLEMGIQGPLSPGQAPMVEGIRRSVDAALAILADLLDVARADSGGLSVERVPVDLAEVARAAVEDHRAAAAAAGHALEVEPPGRPVPVHTDPARVRQVLGNLLSNAIKYTPAPGRITVRAERLEDGGPLPGRWAAVRVSDTGPGIPPGMREAVFDEFTRLDEGSSAPGHGLGLAIARRIARLLGGDLEVEEAPEPGATFVLRLPLRADGPGPAPPATDRAPHPRSA